MRAHTLSHSHSHTLTPGCGPRKLLAQQFSANKPKICVFKPGQYKKKKENSPTHQLARTHIWQDRPAHSGVQGQEKRGRKVCSATNCSCCPRRRCHFALLCISNGGTSRCVCVCVRVTLARQLPTRRDMSPALELSSEVATSTINCSSMLIMWSCRFPSLASCAYLLLQFLQSPHIILIYRHTTAPG